MLKHYQNPRNNQHFVMVGSSIYVETCYETVTPYNLWISHLNVFNIIKLNNFSLTQDSMIRKSYLWFLTAQVSPDLKSKQCLS